MAESLFPEYGFKSDIYLDMSFDMKTDVLTIEDTNVRRDYIDELLSDWVRNQMGRGEDNSPAVERDVYRIRIDVDLSDDTFRARADTGNKGLTAGIIKTSLGKWKFSSALEQKLREEECAKTPETTERVESR